MSASAPQHRRVLHVITGLGMGGAEQILVNCALAGRHRGYEPFVVSLKSGGQTGQFLDDNKIPVVELGMSAGIPDPRRLAQLVKIMNDFSPHLVKSWMYHANVLTSLAAMLARTVTHDQLMWGIYNSSLDLGRYAWTTRMIDAVGKQLSRYPSALVFNSQRASNDHFVAGYRPRETIIVNNGIDLTRFRPNEANRQATRKRLGIAPDAKVAIIVARVDPQKDWETVLEGIARVEGLVTVAVGPTTANLPDQPGLLKHGRHMAMEELYPAADVFLLPSAFGEGTSVAMCEAMACGIPPIVTDVGDNARFANDCGIVIPSRSPDELAKALRSFFKDAGLQEQRGVASRLIAEKNFGPTSSFHALFESWDRKVKTADG